MSDIIHYNRSVIRDYPGCYSVRLRDLFISSERYAFDPHDNVELCPCNKPYCNPSTRPLPSIVVLTLAAILIVALPSIQNFNFTSIQYISSSPSIEYIPKTKLQSRRISRYTVHEIGVS